MPTSDSSLAGIAAIVANGLCVEAQLQLFTIRAVSFGECNALVVCRSADTASTIMCVVFTKDALIAAALIFFTSLSTSDMTDLYSP